MVASTSGYERGASLATSPTLIKVSIRPDTALPSPTIHVAFVLTLGITGARWLRRADGHR